MVTRRNLFLELFSQRKTLSMMVLVVKPKLVNNTDVVEGSLGICQRNFVLFLLSIFTNNVELGFLFKSKLSQAKR